MQSKIKNFFNLKNFLRAIHFIMIVLFLLCIIFLYYYGTNDLFDNKLYIVSGVLFAEAVILVFNRGKCPLEYAHEKVGDKREFFGHFLPDYAVPYVIPVVAIVTIIGFLILYF